MHSVPEVTSIRVFPSIADHKGLMAKVSISAPKEFQVNREVWDFREASWQDIERELAATNWEVVLNCDADTAAE